MSISRTPISHKEQKQHWGTQLRKAPAGASEPAATAIEKCSHARHKQDFSVWRPHAARRWCAQLGKTAGEESVLARRVGTSRHCVTEYLQQDRSTGTLPCALVGMVRTSTDPKDFVTTSETTSTQRSLSLLSR